MSKESAIARGFMVRQTTKADALGNRVKDQPDGMPHKERTTNRKKKKS